MKNDSVLIIRLPAKVKASLKRAADTEMRTLSNLATWVLTSWTRAAKPPPKRPRPARNPSKRSR